MWDLKQKPETPEEFVQEEIAWQAFKREYATRQESIDSLNRSSRRAALVGRVVIAVTVSASLVLFAITTWSFFR